MQVLLLSFLFNIFLAPRQRVVKWDHRGMEPQVLFHSDIYTASLHALIGVTHELFSSVWPLILCRLEYNFSYNSSF